jgi:L-serine kinase (ATP) / ParB family transcriptional regulator, heme-responsive regulator
MPHPDSSSFRLPDLRFIAVDLLVPHEKEDRRRTESIAARLGESKTLRNPPVVTRAPSAERFVVLDGANRVSAVRAAGFPHLVVQVVPYEEPAVRLSTWHHALGKVAAEELERSLASIPGLEPHRENLGHARALLARRESIAFVERAEGGVICLHGGSDLHARNALLNAVVDLYRGKHSYYRVTRDSISEARARHPDAAALVVFPHFHPEEILEVALGGARLPAGITRHVIAWRALRINMPLDVMADRNRKLDEKERWLKEWMAERVAQGSVRFYEESTVLFDE